MEHQLAPLLSEIPPTVPIINGDPIYPVREVSFYLYYNWLKCYEIWHWFLFRLFVTFMVTYLGNFVCFIVILFFCLFSTGYFPCRPFENYLRHSTLAYLT